MRACIQLAASLACAAILAGCAHPITIATEKSAPAGKDVHKINRNIGFVLPDTLRDKEVITPGGGGDKVSYLPYRDLELPLYTTLSNVFSNATKLTSASDATAIRNAKLDYILTPEFVTDSSSDSALTWPPTHFSILMVCTVTDVNGAVVLRKEVKGEGNAEWSEFKRNFALSAHRATEQMLINLQAMLASSTELSGVAPGVAQAGAPAAVPPSPRPAVAAAARPSTAPATTATTMSDLQGLLPAR